MEITEVRIKLMGEPGERLKAFCSITFDDCFVIRDLKIIEGTNGPFVAMPSRKLTSHCSQCGSKNHLRAVYCNECGFCLKDKVSDKDKEEWTKLYVDVAHPINSACREAVQNRVIKDFRTEQQRAAEPDYVSQYEDVDTAPVLSKTTADKVAMEPAVQEPRPPHKTSVVQRSTKSDFSSDSSGDEKETGFGAGIF